MSLELISGIIESAFNVDFKMMIAVIFRTIIVTLLIVFVIKWLGNKGNLPPQKYLKFKRYFLLILIF